MVSCLALSRNPKTQNKSYLAQYGEWRYVVLTLMIASVFLCWEKSGTNQREAVRWCWGYADIQLRASGSPTISLYRIFSVSDRAVGAWVFMYLIKAQCI